ncbi:MAG: DUF2927 domain-containing protein [Pseudomonadota bacterium]
MIDPGTRPAVEGWRAAVPWGSDRYSHRSLAALFRRLSTGFEDGGERDGLLRLRTPVTVIPSGPGSVIYRSFVEDYAAFLERETGIAVAVADERSEGGSDDNPDGGALYLAFVRTGAGLIPPGVRCLHLPGNVNWPSFEDAPARTISDARRAAGPIEAATVFIPAKLEPAAIRACILEEIPQAMGLGNDAPLVAPTIFNDDGAHLWPTRLDLTMLRVLYAPEVTPEASPSVVEAQAIDALSRMGTRDPDARPLPLTSARISERFNRAWKAFMRDGGGRPDSLLNSRPTAGPEAALARCTAGITLLRAWRSPAAEDIAAVEDDCREADADGLTEGVLLGPRVLRLALLRTEALMAEGRPSDALALLEEASAGLAALGSDAGLARAWGLRSAALRDMGRDDAVARTTAAAWARYAFGAGRPVDGALGE